MLLLQKGLLAIMFNRFILPLIWLCVALAAQIAHAHTPKKAHITIKLQADVPHEHDKIYIVGNLLELGNWNPKLMEMKSVGNKQWEFSLDVKSGETIEFKFCRGSWENEALNQRGYISDNNVIHVYRDTVASYTVAQWRDQKPDAQYQMHGQVTGTVKYHRKLVHPQLLPRDAIVWLPPSYTTEPEKRYPVLYMHDGQNVFDPATSSNGYDWRVDEVCDSLIKAGRLQEIIVVAVTNTSDRSSDYGYGEKGHQYADFLINTLKPMIDKTYRTLPDAANTAVMGSSMGGLCAFVLAWEHPEVFSKAGCISPAFKVERIGEDLDYVKTVTAYTGSKKNINIYIDNGTAGLEAMLQPGIDEMMRVLRKKSQPFDWYLAKGAAHNEAAWARRVYLPLEWMFGK